jgi:iron complex outermembrane recepter protein
LRLGSSINLSGEFMFKRTKISTGVLLSIGGILLAPVATQAQEAQRIEVTGSRIVRPGLTSNTPITSITAESLSNLGQENIADLATQLPSFAPSFGSSRTQSTFSGVENSGLNLVNLRNLGSSRSLVLINGRRVPGGLSTDPSPDMNSIPTANIERIDIITGGAGAIYGADAVSGVVNIITKKRFEGVEVTASYGQSDKGDNRNPSGSIIFGGKFANGGNATATLQFDKQGRVSCADRYLCAEDFAWTDPSAPPRRGPAARSGVGVGGRFFVGGDSYTRRNGSFTDANGDLIPFSVPIDGYNRNAARDLAIPTTRIMAAAEAETPITKGISAFAEINYAQTDIKSSFEAHPYQSFRDLFGGPGGVEASIPLDNPFIPPALQSAINAYNADPANAATQISALGWWQRLSGLGTDRGAESNRNTARTVFGLKGEMDNLFGLGSGWRWEASHVYGRTAATLGTRGLVGLGELYEGLRVEADPANPGGFRCVSAVARSQGCVPINPFADYTKAMTDYVRVSSNAVGRSTLNDTVAFLSGSPIELPAGSLRTVIGAEHRSFAGFLDYDNVVNRGLATGNVIGDTDYVKTKTSEVFAELYVPLLADQAFARSMNVEGAFRHSSSKGDNYNTWKFGGDWEPVDGLRFRAMKARSVRAPAPGELSGIATTAGVVNDPCTAARRNANATRAANCATDGVPADYAPALVIEQSVQGFTGGNANLKPEEGTTLTFGAVWAPSFVKGFSISIDRFEVDVEKIITTVDRQLTANLCYDTPNRLLCGAVRRGANPLIPGATYILTAVDENLQNVAKQSIAGVDIDVKYKMGLAQYGDLDFSMLATFYDKAKFVPIPGEEPINQLGQAGGSTTDQGWIRFTANANIGWRMGPFSANWNVRHIGKANMASTGANTTTTDDGFPKIGSHSYHNVRLGYTVKKDFEVFGGITNLFDKQPPFFASGTSGTQALDTIPGYYDVFGRSYFVGARMKF